MHDTEECAVAEYASLFPHWRYADEFVKACEKDGGSPVIASSPARGDVACKREGSSAWEYIEGYMDVRPLYTGPPLHRDFTVLYRAFGRSD